MEEWKDLAGYADYQVSNLGRVKSFKLKATRIKKQYLDKEGYLNVNLYVLGIGKTKRVHQIVAAAFHNHIQNGYHFVINHIDFNRQNNHSDNLEIVTNRVNTNRKHLESTSIYTGVSWCKRRNKWRAQIRIAGKKIHLGYFINEVEASETYEKSIENTT